MIRVAAALVLLFAAPALLAADAFEPFIGHYEGTAISDGGAELSPRDITVDIAREDKGFAVTWVVLIAKSDGRTKRTEFEVRFRPSKRENIYRSAMRQNMFGQAVPLDPLKGDPYVWAKIEGNVLTVHAMLITDDGGYEMQVYERSLVAGGMDLRYSRVRNGEILRTVTGSLKRVR